MSSRVSFVSPNGTWISGITPPSGSDGYVTQFYLDTVTGSVYQKTALTTWTLRTIGSGGGGISGGANLGAGEGIYAGVTGANINFKSLVAGSNISIASSATEITISTVGSGIASLNGLNATTQFFAIDSNGTLPNWSSAIDTHTLNIPFAGTAGVNGGLISNTEYSLFSNKVGDVQSLGTGEHLVGAAVGNTANIKSLVGGTGVTLISTADEVTINASGAVSGGANLGAGEGVYAGVTGSNLEFKSLVAGSNISLSSSANEITISSSGGGGGSPTVIPDGGTLSGTYTGDVLLEGDASCSSDVIVNGNLYSKEAFGKTLSINSYIVNVRGNVTLAEHTISTGTNASGLPYSGFYVKGDLICSSVILDGIAGSAHINGSQLTAGGDIFVLNAVSLAGANDALSGGNGGLLNCENFSALSLNLSGIDSQSAAGTAGTGGQAYVRNTLRVSSSIFALGGASNFPGAANPGGDSGFIICGKLIADSITISGGDGRVGGGNCSNIQVDTEIKVSSSLTASGGSSTNGSGGNASSVSCGGLASIDGEIIMNGGSGGTTGGNGGFISAGSLVGTLSNPISMVGGAGGTGNGGNGGSIFCDGDLNLDLQNLTHTFNGGASSSASGGVGGYITAANISLSCNSLTSGASSYINFNGGDTSTGSAAGNAGSVNSRGSIVSAFPLRLNGGSVSTASTGGSGGSGGLIQFTTDYVCRHASPSLYPIILNGGTGVAQTGTTRSGGRGGMIKGNTNAVAITPNGGRIYGTSTSSSLITAIQLNGGSVVVSATGSSTDPGLGGNGGMLHVGEATLYSVTALGGNMFATGSCGNGGTIQVRGSIYLPAAGTTVINLQGGSAQVGSTSPGGSGGAFSAGEISSFGNIIVSGGNGIGTSSGGGNAGSVVSVKNLGSQSITANGGSTTGSGSGGLGGSIISTYGNITTTSSVQCIGGTSANGSGGSGGTLSAVNGCVILSGSSNFLSGGNATAPTQAASGGAGGTIQARVRIVLESPVSLSGGDVGTPSVDGLVLSSGRGGSIATTTASMNPDLSVSSIASLSLNGGSITAGVRTGSFTVERGGTIQCNNVYIGGITTLNGGGISASASTAGPGANGLFTARGNLVLSASLSLSYGTSSLATTLQNTTTNGLTVYGTTTGARLSAGSTPTINMAGGSSFVSGGASSSVVGMTFHGRVSGKIDLLVRTVNAPASGTVGRCGGIRFYGGCDILGTVTCSESGDPTATPPANNFTTGGIHVNGVCQIYQAAIFPFNAARTTDMTFVCQGANAAASMASLSCGSFTYSYGDGSGSPATFVFRGLAGLAISGAEATTEPNTRHVYTMNSSTNLTYKIQGAPV